MREPLAAQLMAVPRTLLLVLACVSIARCLEKSSVKLYRERVRSMFQHAYEGYMTYAYPYDELQPISCKGHDTWGSFSLTLIDSLDTLVVLGNYTEFDRVVKIVTEHANFDTDVNASVFETNIRVVGGLLSAHLLSMRAGVELEPGWPCSGPLLRLAEDAARRLLPAFNTSTGMPYGTVNLRYGVPQGETTVTCTAGVGTFLVEFGTLSRLTGDPVFEETAMRAMNALWERRSELNMVGNHIDVQTGTWTAVDAGIGAGVDSYIEYLVKGGIMFNKQELLDQFEEYLAAYERHSRRDDWYFWVNMAKGQVTLPIFQSLEAFWPGLKSLYGDVDDAMKTLHNYYQVWQQFGFTPEFFNVPRSEAVKNREGYPLRPELSESIMYLYRATGDPFLLDMGAQIVESIEHSCRTRCGYAVVKDATSHALTDRMESFFLAETTKYLFLLFDEDNFVHNDGGSGVVIDTPSGECVVDAGGYFFNTEAHLIDVAALDCCAASFTRDHLANRIFSKISESLAHGGENSSETIVATVEMSDVPAAAEPSATATITAQGYRETARSAAAPVDMSHDCSQSDAESSSASPSVCTARAATSQAPIDRSDDLMARADLVQLVLGEKRPASANVLRQENRASPRDENSAGEKSLRNVELDGRHRSHMKSKACPVRSFISRFALFGEVIPEG